LIRVVKRASGIVPAYAINPTAGPLGYKVSPDPNDPKKSLEFKEQQKKAAQTEWNMVTSQDTGAWKTMPEGRGNLIMPVLMP
jgi:hypothetical protein